MFKLTKNKIDHEEKNAVIQMAEQELSEAELAKVAGGIPPRSGGTGAEI